MYTASSISVVIQASRQILHDLMGWRHSLVGGREGKSSAVLVSSWQVMHSSLVGAMVVAFADLLDVGMRDLCSICVVLLVVLARKRTEVGSLALGIETSECELSARTSREKILMG